MSHIWLADEEVLDAALVDSIGLNRQEIEQTLQQQGFVHGDGCLHLTAEVSQVI